MSKIDMGPRTVFALEALGISSLDYQKEKYEILNTTIDFTKKSSGLASVGLAKEREVLLISEKDKKTIIKQWDNFCLETKKVLTLERILSLLNSFTRSVLNAENPKMEEATNFFVEKISKSGRTTILPNLTDAKAVIFISEFLDMKCGMCRHHALINGIILAHLINTHQIAAGQVRQFRDETMDDTVNERSGAHAVTTYITPEGKIWVLDSLNFSEAFQLDPESQFLLESQKITKQFQTLVGKNFYDSMFVRLLSFEQKKEVYKDKVIAATPPLKLDVKYFFERDNVNIQNAHELKDIQLKLDIALLELLGKSIKLKINSIDKIKKLIAEASKAIDNTKNPRVHFADPIFEAAQMVKDNELPSELKNKILAELKKYIFENDAKEKIKKGLSELNRSSEYAKDILAASNKSSDQAKYVSAALNDLGIGLAKPNISSP